MRSNPLVTEALAGLTRQGRAQLDYLGLLALQAAALLIWWPKSGLTQALEAQHGPNSLAVVVITVGLTLAYFALRAGAEEFLLPGQHGLRDWARATPLGLGRILHGYVLGQIVHSLHLLALSSPLLLMAFTISGGEWVALGWCLMAALVQALFYRLCGAITHLAIGQHRIESHVTVRTILFFLYVLVGWLAPITSHVALTSRMLGESVAVEPAFAAMPDHLAFLTGYAGLGVLAVLVLHRLLARERRGTPDPGNLAGVGEVATG